MTDTHALQAIRDKVAAGDLPGILPIAFCDSVLVIGAFHGSLSAALDLHYAAIPWWNFEITNHVAEVRKRRVWFGVECMDNPARAWLLAILDALIYETNETSDKA